MWAGEGRELQAAGPSGKSGCTCLVCMLQRLAASQPLVLI